MAFTTFLAKTLYVMPTEDKCNALQDSVPSVQFKKCEKLSSRKASQLYAVSGITSSPG